MRNVLPILCLLILAPASSPMAAQEAAPAEMVSLTFAWAPGIRASVSSTRTRTRDVGERSSSSLTSRYTLYTEAADAQLRIRFADPALELSGDQGSLPAQAQAQLVAQAADLMPDYLVNLAGELIGIVDLPAYQSKIRAFLGDLLPADTDPGLVSQVQALVTSEAFLTSRVAEQWNIIVGNWAGGELELGAEHTYSNPEPSPMFPGEKILMNYAFSVARLVSCERGGAARRCAELEMRSAADPEDTERVIQTLFDKVAGDAMPEAPTFRSLEVESVLVLVTEPAGLIPHRYTLTKTVLATMLVEGEEQSIEQVDQTEVTFTYP